MLVTRRQLVAAGVAGAALASSPTLSFAGGARDVRGTVGGINGHFLVDREAPGILLLDGRASARLGLWESDRAYVPLWSRSFGGASVATRMYRVEGLILDGEQHDSALVRVMAPGEASAGFSQYDGIAGAAEAEDYPMSGLWLRRRHGKVLVSDVGKSSPAWKAGLRVGDRIIGEKLDPLVARISGKTGERIALSYQRDGKTASAEFTLQPYL